MGITRRAVLTGVAAGVAATTAAPAASAMPLPMPRPTLKLGLTGSAVLTLQKRLLALGYWLSTPNGVFGGTTQQAVFALQGAAGLHRDGVVGPSTWAALDAGRRPTPRTRSGNAIEVDVPRGLILVVLDGRLSLTLHTSTGGEYYYTRPDGTTGFAHTPRGSFSFLWRYTSGWKTGPLGSMYKPAFFNSGGYAIHGSNSIPGYPASHGCCRVHNAAMDMLYARNLIPLGRRVLVY